MSMSSRNVPEPEVSAFDEMNPQDVSWAAIFPQRLRQAPPLAVPVQLMLPFDEPDHEEQG